MTGSRISVEIAGDSAPLKAAVTQAADALKGLGDVLARQTDIALKAGDKTIKANQAVAASFERAAAAASSSTRDMSVSYTAAADKSVGASDRMIAATERQAEAAQKSADAQVRANDLAAASAARAAERQAASQRKVESAFGSSSSKLTKAGKMISLGLIGAAAASVDLGVKFEANTARMQTQAGATAKQVDQLRQGMLKMAAQVGFTPDQLATGMYHVVSSMNAVLPPTQRVTVELKVMRAAAQGAAVGHSNLEDTTYALASALNALHDPGRDAQHVMGLVNATVGAGDMTMQDYIDSLRSGLIPGARQAGLSMSSLGAALAVMGDMGMRGALAGTRLRMSIALLSSPSAAAAKVLQTLGMSADQATSTSQSMALALQQAGLRTTTLSGDLHKPDGLMVALADLNRHLRESGMTATGAAAVMSKAFGGGRMGATITLLAQNTGRLQTKFDQINKSAGNFGHDFAVTTHTARFQLHSMEAELAAVGTRIGTDLLPYVKAGVHDLSDFVGWLERGGAAAHALEIGVGTLAGVAIGSYLVSQLKKANALLRDFRMAAQWIGGRFGLGSGVVSRAGAGAGAGGGVGSLTGGAMGIGGARSGYGLPGSIANPIIVAMEAGEYAGLGSMGAAGTVATETRAAAAEAGAVESATGAAAPIAGTAATAAEATATRGAAESGMLAGAVGTLKGVAGRLMGGGMLAMGGIAASQMAGSMVGGGAGSTVSRIGSMASAGAGLGMLAGPEGALVGAIGGALIGGLTNLFKSQSYGQQIAASLSKGFGGANRSNLQGTVGHALDQLHQYTTTTRTQLGPRGSHIQVPVNVDFSKLSNADQQKAMQDANTAGQAIARQLEAGWSQYKFQSEPVMLIQLRAEIKKLPPEAQAAAIESAVKFSQALEKQGRLAAGSTRDFLAQIEQQFPGFEKYVGLSATASLQTFNKAMALSTAQQNLSTALQNVENDFSGVQTMVANTSGTIQDKGNAALQVLDGLAQGTGASARLAQQAVGRLQSATGQDMDAMVAKFQSSTSDITTALQAGSLQATQAAESNYSGLVSTIQGDINSGLTSTTNGLGDIGKALNAMLKAFGEPAIKFTGIASHPGAGGASLATLKANAKAVGHATGGYIGTPGQQGRDTVPTMLGAGEAVLNHAQQGVVNGALAAVGIGGLPALFANVTRPHYMASGGYVNPIPGFTLGRKDMGVDANAPVGTPIVAIGDSTLRGYQPNWYAGQPLLDFQLSDGPDAGRYWYVAEQILPVTTKIGSAFRAGQIVARYAPSGTGIEIGWAANAAGTTLAQATGQTGSATHANASAGLAFAAFLSGLAAGKIVSGGPGVTAGGATAIRAPGVTGTGPVASIVSAALGTAAGAANAYLSTFAGITPASTGGGVAPIPLSPAARGAGSFVVGASEFGGPGDPTTIGNSGAYGADVLGSIARLQSGGAYFSQLAPGSRWNLTASTGRSLTATVTDLGAGGGSVQGHPRAIDLWWQTANALGLPGTAGTWTGLLTVAKAMAEGGFTGDVRGHGAAHFPSRVIGVKAPKPPRVGAPPKGISTGMTTKDMQALSAIGGQINAIEQQIATTSGTYSADATTFPPQEAAAQYVNPDGSINAAGYAKKVSDDQTLLGLDQTLLGLYQQEVPIVSAQLTKWFGKDSNTQAKITANMAKIAADRQTISHNKVKEGSIRQAMLDLRKPVPNAVAALELQIQRTRLAAQKNVASAQQALQSFDNQRATQENALKGAVLQAEINGTDPTAKRLAAKIASTERARDTYTGHSRAERTRLANAVTVAELAYRSYAGTHPSSNPAVKLARQQLSGYETSSASTKLSLSEALQNARDSERQALSPLQSALLAAKAKQQARAFRIKSETYDLDQKLAHLTAQDTRLTARDSALTGRDTNLRAILSGANGAGINGSATGVAGAISILETVASKLGMVNWSNGQFVGIDTTMPGEIVSVKADIQSLTNDIGQAQAGQGTASTTDLTAQIQIEEQLALQISEGNALLQAQSKVLEGFLPMLGATAIPSYDEGGPIVRDTLANVHGGEYVVPRGGSLVMRDNPTGSNPSTIELHQHYHGSAGTLMSLIDQRIQHPSNVLAISKQIGRRTRMLSAAPGR